MARVLVLTVVAQIQLVAIQVKFVVLLDMLKNSKFPSLTMGSKNPVVDNRQN